jgi:hypothetical protein
MRKLDRQKLSILLILLGVLAFTLILGYRMDRPAVTAAVQVPETKTSANPPAPTDARIRLDLVEKQQPPDEVGRKNPFQYREAPPPPPPGQGGQRGQNGGPGGAAPGTGAPGSGSDLATGPTRPAGPPPPPPPPPIPLKYPGYASEGGRITAFLIDDSSRHYNVTVGEVLMGRYRVAQISPNSVEIEDLDNNRRQTLPLLK